MNRIPEPHEIADAYFLGIEQARRKYCEGATCADCESYYAAPDEWVREPCGYCPEAGEHVRGADRVSDFECDSFTWRTEPTWR